MGSIRGARLAKWSVAAVLATSFFSAHAATAEDNAWGGAIADGVSTAVGLAAGAAELNPLGPVLAIGVKVAVMQYAKGLPDTERPAVHAAAASLWQGAAVNNVCVAASILSGGSFAPVCIVAGVAWGYKTWTDSEQERQFWEGCAMLRQYAGTPDLPCVYTPQDKTQLALAAPHEVTVQVLEEPEY
jgi:hypothetical protein